MGLASEAGEWLSARAVRVLAGVLEATAGDWLAVRCGPFWLAAGKSKRGRRQLLAGRFGCLASSGETAFSRAFLRPQPNIRNIIGRCVGICEMAANGPWACGLGLGLTRWRRVSGSSPKTWRKRVPRIGAAQRVGAAPVYRAVSGNTGMWRRLLSAKGLSRGHRAGKK